MDKRFYNCHAHCFTYDHVPEFFLTRRIAISWLLKRRWLRELIRKSTSTGKFTFGIRVLLFLLRLLFGLTSEMALRYMNFVRYGDRSSQEQVIKSMQAYYPKDTGMVFLTMDMEYMGAGVPQTRFKKQLSELEGVKRNPHWTHKVYPFVFCDPRRIMPQHKREIKVEQEFIGAAFENKAKEYLQKGIYQGIKIYPALGYYPFDIRMKTMYDYALQHCIPILTHCTIGAVHFKYKLNEEERYHPFLKTTLPEKKPVEFQEYFTHPLNFECLLNPDILRKLWGDATTDYTNLKICLGHWGQGEDWHEYLDNAWQDTNFRKRNSAWCSLELDNWIINEDNAFKNFSWFTIICDLMRKYPNVYADISYTLYDTTLLPLLKMILEADKKIRERVLFGTDFYLVSKASSERAFAINVRAALGDALFEQIAVTNAERFLSNKFNPVNGNGIIAEEKPGLANAVVC
jgi:predicted TIM-barrel fold metal-dependent hydrolase